MSIKQCAACGASVPEYYLSRGVCDGCKWDTWIPREFVIREKYAYSEIWGHSNATVRPVLGVEFLDRRAVSVADLLPMCTRKPRSAAWARRGDTSEGGR